MDRRRSDASDIARRHLGILNMLQDESAYEAIFTEPHSRRSREPPRQQRNAIGGVMVVAMGVVVRK